MTARRGPHFRGGDLSFYSLLQFNGPFRLAHLVLFIYSYAQIWAKSWAYALFSPRPHFPLPRWFLLLSLKFSTCDGYKGYPQFLDTFFMPFLQTFFYNFKKNFFKKKIQRDPLIMCPTMKVRWWIAAKKKKKTMVFNINIKSIRSHQIYNCTWFFSDPV